MSLTPRQKQIAGLVARGYTTKQISVVTGLSPFTVQNHIVQAAERLDGQQYPRSKLTLWFLAQPDDDVAA